VELIDRLPSMPLVKHALVDCSLAHLFWLEIKKLTGIKLPNLHPVS
jgi:hypothetical protein